MPFPIRSLVAPCAGPAAQARSGVVRRGLLVATAAAALLVSPMTASTPARAADQTATCVDGGGTRWSATATWGTPYTAADRSRRLTVDHLAWTTSRKSTTPTDALVRSYDGSGRLLRTLSWSGRVAYRGGSAMKTLPLFDLRPSAGQAYVRVTLGVAGDGAPGCTLSFRATDSGAAARAVTVPRSITADCSADVTGALNRWIATVPNHSTLVFGLGRCYRIDGTVQIRGRSRLTLLGRGSQFRSVAAMVHGRAKDDQRAMFRVLASSAVGFRDMIITGAYRYGGTFDATLQHAHGIDSRGSNISLSRVQLSRLAGDCVYFGRGPDGTTKSSGRIHRSRCTAIGRNAVSLTAARGVVIRTTTIDKVGRDAFAVEPNRGAGWGVAGVDLEANTVRSYRGKLLSVVASGKIEDVTFKGNGVLGHGLRIAVGDPFKTGHRPADLIVSGNSSDTRQSGIPFNVEGADRLVITNNAVTLRGDVMAAIDRSCKVRVSGNSFSGGSRELALFRPLTAC
jgi:hypothetical protein